MRKLIKKILKEENELEWAQEVVNDMPKVYRFWYRGYGDDDEGYFTMDAFRRYLNERNQQLMDEGNEPENFEDFGYSEININW